MSNQSEEYLSITEVNAMFAEGRVLNLTPEMKYRIITTLIRCSTEESDQWELRRRQERALYCSLAGLPMYPVVEVHPAQEIEIVE
jgi:hypothetical protein